MEGGRKRVVGQFQTGKRKEETNPTGTGGSVIDSGLAVEEVGEVLEKRAGGQHGEGNLGSNLKEGVELAVVGLMLEYG